VRLKRPNTAVGIKLRWILSVRSREKKNEREREPVPRDPLPSSVYVLWIAAIVVLAGLGIIGLLGQ